MALIKCPECGREISDKVEMCPGCGISSKEIFKIIREQEDASYELDYNNYMVICPNCGQIENYNLSHRADKRCFRCSTRYVQTDVTWIKYKDMIYNPPYNGALIAFREKIADRYCNNASQVKEKEAQMRADTLIREQNENKVTLSCPICGKKNVNKISTLNRVASVATVGLASGKIGKQYKCTSCGHMW